MLFVSEFLPSAELRLVLQEDMQAKNAEYRVVDAAMAASTNKFVARETIGGNAIPAGISRRLLRRETLRIETKGPRSGLYASRPPSMALLACPVERDLREVKRIA